MAVNTILCLGMGYVAQYLTRKLNGWHIFGTKRASSLGETVENIFPFDGENLVPALEGILPQVTHLLISIPGNTEQHCSALTAMQGLFKSLRWVGYLSSTSVYGDHRNTSHADENQHGAWVTEGASLRAGTLKGQERCNAEKRWYNFSRQLDIPYYVFRLAAIYGPGRNTVEALLKGKKLERVDTVDHYFSRIHIADLIKALTAALLQENTNENMVIYNLADDYPSPSRRVIEFACDLMGYSYPPLIPLHQVSAELQPYYQEKKRVCNQRMKEDLLPTLLYPSYQEGLKALYDSIT